MRTANDAAARHFFAGLRIFRVVECFIVRIANVDAAPIDGLAVFVGFLDEVQDAAHDEGPRDLSAKDTFFLEADGDERGCDSLGGSAIGKLNVFAEP